MDFRRLMPFIIAAPLIVSTVRIYVTNSDDNKVSIIDPATDRVAGELAVSPNPHGIVASPDGTRFYVSSESKDVIDVKTERPEYDIPAGGIPRPEQQPSAGAQR